MSARSGIKENHRNQPKPLWIVGVAALASIVIGGIWLGVGAVGNHKSEVSVAEAAALHDQGAFFLDVRTQGEWTTSHVPGSTLIPLNELPQRVSEVPRDRQVVVICASGVLSRAARDILIGVGFTKVSSMTGGLQKWQAQGYPMVTGP
jgi:rhodanese-related sulfurtransferase